MNCIFSVEEATNKIYTRLAETTNWKYLKSRRCLKNTFQDLIFEIQFYSSKWNCSYQSINMKAEFSILYKTFGKPPVDANNIIAYMVYEPDGEYWYDISTAENLNSAFIELNNKIQKTAVNLYKQFKENYLTAVTGLLTDYFDEYHVYLDFIADKLGKESVQEKAQEIYDNLPDNIKQQIPEYKNGAQNKSWMVNRNNLKYIIDNDFITL